jgi:mono/diheme cytochrome c family protein
MSENRRRPFVALAIAVLLCGVAIGLRAEGAPVATERERVRMAQYDPEDTWTQADILVLGARVFDNRCSPCHGDQGFGDGELADVLPLRPRNYHTEPFKWGNSPSRIATTVAAGRSGIMPPFKTALTEEEIWAVAYVVWRWVPKDQRGYDTREEALRWTLP